MIQVPQVVAVTGATGYVGRFVIAELQRQGVLVQALARPASDRGGFAAPVAWVTGDLRAEQALVQLVSGADAVVHLAYEHVPGRYRGGEGADLAAWLDANLTGSLRLLLAARDAGVRRFVFLSSRAVFSHTGPGRALDESHPTAPDTHYGAYKAAVEAFLRSFAHVKGMQTAAIRATGVYGLTWLVQRSKWWDLIQAVLSGQVVTSTRGGTEVHGEDVARVVWSLLQQPVLTTDVIHLSDLYVTHRDIVRLAREYADRPGPLPDPPISPPCNVLVCRRLAELGITLGGWPALERTIAALVHAAKQSSR
ncbi:MAG: NAD(P)-dependent oxidoreductase [Chloroflexi bacterium]|nr:NAD(P)-dependent oxidoreductase [Chloroflexota bacterium]